MKRLGLKPGKRNLQAGPPPQYDHAEKIRQFDAAHQSALNNPKVDSKV